MANQNDPGYSADHRAGFLMDNASDQDIAVPAISSWIKPAGAEWTGPSIQQVLETVHQAVRNYQQAIQTHQNNVQIYHQAVRQRVALIPDLHSAVQQVLVASTKRQTKRNLKARPGIMVQLLQASKALDDADLVVEDADSANDRTYQQVSEARQALMSAAGLVSAEYQRSGRVIQVSDLEWQNVLNADQAVQIAIDQERQVIRLHTRALQEQIQASDEIMQIMAVME